MNILIKQINETENLYNIETDTEYSNNLTSEEVFAVMATFLFKKDTKFEKWIKSKKDD